MPDLKTPVINEEADRALGKIIVRWGIPTVFLAAVIPPGMALLNTPQSRFYPEHRFLDILSLLVILTPFFLGINRLFAARLRLGRALVAERRWREAVAALDPFAGLGQRFLDGTGEAHYLLAQAYAGVGEKAKAETARQFVRRHRPGPWAARLVAPPGPTPLQRQEKRSRPTNGKPRRRF